jgi:hypothetical protein
VSRVGDVENTFDSLLRGAGSGDFTDQPTGAVTVASGQAPVYRGQRMDQDTCSVVLDIPNAFAFLEK